MTDDKQQQPEDPNQDIPAEANRNKHINFLDVEEESGNKTDVNDDSFATERRKQWKKGLQEGEEAQRNTEG